MSKTVVMRKSGNSRILTVPQGFEGSVGEKFDVEFKDGNIIYKPHKHVNIFATKEWQEYDYQKDLIEDKELSELKPVGKEVLD
ncbi:hypothetical protein O2U01_00185 (plasmid) [Ligilactobacillus salivarius]|uniref:AbrB family transcriptional regulator n=1 Tax=Ligilactobacillus salivarius TaxID=1624 RepID=A0ABD7YXZ7_9LACO|nr:hypothetical protein [Ligilactobacillus salivarius]WHS05266.1 hypothetical protein O2U07_01280 [Ligilactobacillus salivarius]WHS07190.1 hypothetical protein O2U05_00200 [Ligilactobacillus salivarius]WHS10991.1 hypothetical protein O2U04_10075 [Ligilactobacillus salivarius]WHS15267.1 hypothetical protein O2U03_10930 [Ligilactobacillus salivarius]WHS18813.1 hypothetical protein O2U02_11085 [Ligilactobacillus salivarius]